MERHGYYQPALPHLQQPDPRRPPQSAGRRVPRSGILSVLCQQWTADLRPGCPAVRSVMQQVIAVVSVMAAGAAPLYAASEADFSAAYGAAEVANKQAGALRNQWTTTEATLAAAK